MTLNKHHSRRLLPATPVLSIWFSRLRQILIGFCLGTQLIEPTGTELQAVGLKVQCLFLLATHSNITVMITIIITVIIFLISTCLFVSPLNPFAHEITYPLFSVIIMNEY